MAHRPYTAGAICVITPAAVLYIYYEFRPGPGVGAGILRKRGGVFVSSGGQETAEAKGFYGSCEGYIKTLMQLARGLGAIT